MSPKTVPPVRTMTGAPGHPAEPARQVLRRRLGGGPGVDEPLVQHHQLAVEELVQ